MKIRQITSKNKISITNTAYIVDYTLITTHRIFRCVICDIKKIVAICCSNEKTTTKVERRCAERSVWTANRSKLDADRSRPNINNVWNWNWNYIYIFILHMGTTESTSVSITVFAESSDCKQKFVYNGKLHSFHCRCRKTRGDEVTD